MGQAPPSLSINHAQHHRERKREELVEVVHGEGEVGVHERLRDRHQHLLHEFQYDQEEKSPAQEQGAPTTSPSVLLVLHRK